MSSLKFSSPPAFPLTLDESIIPGASYQQFSPSIEIVKHTVRCIQRRFDQYHEKDNDRSRAYEPSPSDRN